jgi:hypothetical protein
MRGPSQRGQEGVGHRRDAEDVRLIDPPESGHILSIWRLVIAGNASVVDQDVQHVDPARGVGDARGVGHVEHEQPGVAAYLLHGALAAYGVARADVNGQTRVGELSRNLLAYALVGPGDQCDQVVHAVERARQRGG